MPIFAVAISQYLSSSTVVLLFSLARNKSILLIFKADRPQLSIFFDHAAQRHFGIVIEKAEPAFARRLWQETLFRFKRLDRVEVVAHDPGERHMSARRDQVGEAEEVAPAARQANTLHRARMTCDGLHLQPRHDLIISL